MEGRAGLPGLVLALLLAAAPPRARALDEEMAELARMLRENCAEETGVDISLLDRINAGADLMPDPKLKCYIKCVMETAGMMSEGEMDVEATLAMMPDELRRKIEGALRACGTRRGADPCDTAYLTQRCWQAANKPEYFII